MSRFRKRPVVVEAVQWNGGTTEGLTKLFGDFKDWRLGPNALRIKTFEGWTEASHGDWVVKGTKGEFYPVKPDVFEEVYEEAD